MADPLSLAASAFAVAGVADLLLKYSVECCHFLSEIKDAPTEVQRLLTCLQENTLLIETSKHYLDELASSRCPSTPDLTRASHHFSSAIRALDRELAALVALTKKYKDSQKSWGKIKWVLDKQKINGSMRRLENSKATLTSALVLVGWFV